MVAQLVQVRADINEPMRFPSGCLMSFVFGYLSLQYRLGARRTAAVLGFHSYDATPLMLAVINGQYEAAMALIEFKARVDLMNVRKKTALDLAVELDVPSILLEALRGETAVCNRIVASALNNRYPVAHTF